MRALHDSGCTLLIMDACVTDNGCAHVLMIVDARVTDSGCAHVLLIVDARALLIVDARELADSRS